MSRDAWVYIATALAIADIVLAMATAFRYEEFSGRAVIAMVVVFFYYNHFVIYMSEK